MTKPFPTHVIIKITSALHTCILHMSVVILIVGGERKMHCMKDKHVEMSWCILYEAVHQFNA